MFGINPYELMIILVIALLVVGPKKLPDLGRSIGKGLREFRKAQDEVRETLRLELDDEEPSKPITRPRAAPAPRPSAATEPAPNAEPVESAEPDAATPPASPTSPTSPTPPTEAG